MSESPAPPWIQAVVADLVKDLVGSLRGVADADAPLVTEVVISRLVVMIDDAMSGETEQMQAGFWSEVASGLGARGDEPAAILSTGLARLIDQRWAEPLRRVAREQGAVGPAWLDRLGAAKLRRAVVLEHLSGDGIGVTLGYEPDPGSAAGSAHSVLVYIDNNLGGLAVDIGIGPPIDEIAARSAADPLLVVRPVAPGAALGLVGAGFDQTTDTDGAPTTDGYDRLRSLLVMRVNHGGVPVQMPPYPVEMEDDEVDALVEEFLRTESGNRLAAKPETVAEIVRMWLAHAVTRTVGDPLRVSAVLVEMFLTDWAPRYPSDDPDGLAAVPDVIAEWLRFVAARRSVPSALLTHALAAVEHYTPVMQHRAASYQAGAGAGAE